MKYYIVAGEASGDLHASNLIKSLKKSDSLAQFRGWGGDLMRNAGVQLAEHYKNTAFMGFIEVVTHLRTILGFIAKCKRDIDEYKPDVVILIDYPGFNLKIAQWAKKQGFKVVYYITPQVWAWHESRVHTLGKYTDLLLVILPFEADFFKKHGYNAIFVGHPLLDAIDAYQPDLEWAKKYLSQKPIILLPGSRKQEIRLILPQMLKAVKNTESPIIIGAALSIDDDLYSNILEKEGMTEQVDIVRNRTYDLLSIADIALVGSGTATLETALFQVPQVVCYKGNTLSYIIAKQLVNLNYISLVNLIVDKEVVKELIQNDLTVKNIKIEMDNLYENRRQIIKDYEDIIQLLGNIGASDRAANEVLKLIN